jgi:hypothetical protein
LKIGASALALSGLRLRFPAPAGAQHAASSTSEVCVLTPEEMEGPYYLPLDLLREDITEPLLRADAALGEHHPRS